MALNIDLQTDFGGGIIASYHRVNGIISTKMPDGYLTFINTASYKDEDAAKVEGAQPLMVERYDTSSVPMTLADAYTYLKTLDTFKTATDI